MTRESRRVPIAGENGMTRESRRSEAGHERERGIEVAQPGAAGAAREGGSRGPGRKTAVGASDRAGRDDRGSPALAPVRDAHGPQAE